MERESRERVTQEEESTVTTNTATASEDDGSSMKVRVVLRQPPTPVAERTGETQATPMAYDYHYGRLALVALCVVILVVGAFFGLKKALVSPQTPATQAVTSDEQPLLSTAESVPPEVVIAPDREAASDDDIMVAEIGEVEANDTETTTAELTEVTTVDWKETAVTETADTETTVVETSVAQTDGVKAIIEEDLVETNADTQLAETERRDHPPSVEPGFAQQVLTQSVGPLVRVDDATVVRASIAWGVTDLEPNTPVVENPLVFQPGEEVKKVYFYTQVDGRAGDTLYYRWLLNDKLMASVEMSVLGNRWRSYSSKQILPKYQGHWQALLEDSEGQVLAVVLFDVAAGGEAR